MSNRINPAQVSGTITATGTANAIGPYKYRIGSSSVGVAVTLVSTNTTDVLSVVAVPPDADFTSGNNTIITYASLGVPNCLSFSAVAANNSTLPNCDIYVYATTCTGTISVVIAKLPGYGVK